MSKRMTQINVFYHGRKVGTLVLYKRHFAAFQYDDQWIGDGFSISPFSLPLEKRIFIPKIDPFDGIYGVFADSLPDGWGRLLVDRMMRINHMDPAEMGNLDRLAIVSDSGMGALTYEPEWALTSDITDMELDCLAEECSRILRSEPSQNLDQLYLRGGSSGGARPKILTEVDGTDWIIKFPSSFDDKNIGKQEYDYALCAKECGIEMTEVRLFDSDRCSGYFGTRRFDRRKQDGKEERIHMISVSALLETSHRIPNLDYDILMKLTRILTESEEEMEKMYRLMCFNVFAHNRDDHSKNFAYLYEESEKRWVLSPAYDLTYSNSLEGEHATMVHGNGRNPGIKDILSVAKEAGMDIGKAKRIGEDVRECVFERLGGYLSRG